MLVQFWRGKSGSEGGERDAEGRAIGGVEEVGGYSGEGVERGWRMQWRGSSGV